MTILIAYPLSRRDFYGRKVIMMALVFTMMFFGGLIPTYLTVRAVGILNTRLAMVLPQALAVWQVIIARTFFQSTIADELVEAADIDGCSDLGFVWSVVLPLSKPIIAVLVLLYAVNHWNAYFDALVYLHDTALFPLQIILRNVLILNDAARAAMRASQEIAREGLIDILKYAVIVIASVPVMILYPFAQKALCQGCHDRVTEGVTINFALRCVAPGKHLPRRIFRSEKDSIDAGRTAVGRHDGLRRGRGRGSGLGRRGRR